jgi:hypothetical protein
VRHPGPSDRIVPNLACGEYPARTPVAALEFAQREKLQGPVFNDYDFGGFLIHAGIPTFIDGRGELFGGDFIDP